MKKVNVIYIETGFDCILSRLNREEIAKRPLLKDLDSDGIKKLYKERVKIYEEVADYKAQNYNEVLEFITKIQKE
jgi:shikimate kinase